MSVKLYSAQTFGLKGQIIAVELDLFRGLYCFSIVGLADKAVDESKERVSAAIKNSGFHSPLEKQQRIIVSLGPADFKKEGPVFDLAIALSYILASGQSIFSAEKKIFLGELALDGSVRPIKGALILTQTAKENGFEEIFLPKENAAEAALVEGVKIFGIASLVEVVGHLANGVKIKKQEPVSFENSVLEDLFNQARLVQKEREIDFSDIRGQESAKRGLMIAAAGGHNAAMIGPPGTGKTLLAKALPSILPAPNFEEMMDIISISSIAGNLLPIFSQNEKTSESAAHKFNPFFVQRPFRSPHHTASYTALVGGGAWPKPGEITLAHRGVLFLDEFPEFERRVIEALRQPLEDGIIAVSRIKDTIQFPAKIILIIAMNPCPCGHLGSKTKMCLCNPAGIFRYQRKISGPIADRIDLWFNVDQIDHQLLGLNSSSERSEVIQKKVERARNIQRERFKSSGISANGEMSVRDLDKFIQLSSSTRLI